MGFSHRPRDSVPLPPSAPLYLLHVRGAHAVHDAVFDNVGTRLGYVIGAEVFRPLFQRGKRNTRFRIQETGALVGRQRGDEEGGGWGCGLSLEPLTEPLSPLLAGRRCPPPGTLDDALLLPCN